MFSLYQHGLSQNKIMLKYIVTIAIDSSIADEWKTWMLTKHIKDVMSTKCFTNFKFETLSEIPSEKKL